MDLLPFRQDGLRLVLLQATRPVFGVGDALCKGHGIQSHITLR
jgi:hypothetical protein